jgi:hypothetical protein
MLGTGNSGAETTTEVPNGARDRSGVPGGPSTVLVATAMWNSTVIFAAMLTIAVIFASVLAVAMEAWLIAAEGRDDPDLAVSTAPGSGPIAIGSGSRDQLGADDGPASTSFMK